MNRPICSRLKISLFPSVLLLSLITATAIQAGTIRVPQDVPTIQGAINAAIDGDTVLVGPGTYFEVINFYGKGITVNSEQGPQVTIIDGLHKFDSVVKFETAESQSSKISGFTIKNGLSFSGGGIFIRDASPIIEGNIISNNEAGDGAGILVIGGSAKIEGNEISNNRIRSPTSSELGGGGILVRSANGAQISRNTIVRNVVSSGRGGGVHVTNLGSVTLNDNIISDNSASFGGGIFIDRSITDALIIQNVIVRNFAFQGGGVAWWLSGSQLINNTIADNDSSQGSGVILLLTPSIGNVLIANNIIVAKPFQTALDCLSAVTLSTSYYRFNNVFSPAGLSYGYSCEIPTPVDGNFSVDPRFVDSRAGDYRLKRGSPSIDYGSNDIPHLPSTDFNGSPRISDGDGDGVTVIDIGAYEYSNAPIANAGADQIVDCDANCRANVTLNGGGSYDPDGEQLSYSWVGSFGTITGATPSVSLPKGQHTSTLTVTDLNGLTSTDTVVITVIDATPPTIASASASPNNLLQANHQMVPIKMDVSATDNCDPSVMCRILSVTSNEPVEGLGDGDTSPDWVVTGDLTVDLRAERSGKGTGRVYTITMECADSSGNKSSRNVTVNVPRNN